MAARKEDDSIELKYVVDFYRDDFNEAYLSSQLRCSYGFNSKSA